MAQADGPVHPRHDDSVAGSATRAQYDSRRDQPTGWALYLPSRTAMAALKATGIAEQGPSRKTTENLYLRKCTSRSHSDGKRVVSLAQ